MTTTRAPLDPIIKCRHYQTTSPITVIECILSLDSPPDICLAPITPLHVLPPRHPAQCRTPEQDDINEILHFLNQTSRRVIHVYHAISAIAASVFHVTITTVQWLVIVAFVIEVMMLMMNLPSVRGDYRSGFIDRLVQQLTSTATPKGDSKTAAALNFLSDQIDHAHNLLALVEGLGDDAFFKYHHANVERFLNNSSGYSPSGKSITEVNLIVDLSVLDSTLIQSLSPHGFIGRTISYALDELIYHSERSHTAFLGGPLRDSRLDSVLMLTTSNLLLEFSSILSQTESIIPDVEVIHRHLSCRLPEVLAGVQSREAAASRRSIWGAFASQRLHLKAVEEDSVLAFVAGLEAVISNLQKLKAYMEWITNQLSGRSPLTKGSIVSPSSYISCSSALKDLLDRASRASKKVRHCCRCPDLKGSPTAPTKLASNIPGSPTLGIL